MLRPLQFCSRYEDKPTIMTLQGGPISFIFIDHFPQCTLANIVKSSNVISILHEDNYVMLNDNLSTTELTGAVVQCTVGTFYYVCVQIFASTFPFS